MWDFCVYVCDLHVLSMSLSPFPSLPSSLSLPLSPFLSLPSSLPSSLSLPLSPFSSLSLPLSSPSSSAAPVTSLAADATPSTTSRTESFAPTGNHRPTSDARSPPLTQGQYKTLPCTISDTERGCGSIIRASYLISVALYYRYNTERGCGSANIRKSY